MARAQVDLAWQLAEGTSTKRGRLSLLTYHFSPLTDHFPVVVRCVFFGCLRQSR
jgi:hypothetical protein